MGNIDKPSTPGQVPDKNRTRLGQVAEVEEKWRREGKLPGQLSMAVASAGRPGIGLLPAKWSVWYVLDRLCDMYLVLGRLPSQTRPRRHSNSMPRYAHSEEDLRGRTERFGFSAPGLWVEKGWDDIEREIERMHHQRNRSRAAPTPAELTKCEQAMGWPARYIGSRDGHEKIAKAVLHAAQWHAYGMSVPEQCRRLGFSPKTLRRRQTRGLVLITAGLIRDRVPVS